jgi:acetylglutamate kinase
MAAILTSTADMKMVIKIGDRLLGEAAALDKCGAAFCELIRDGHRVIVVHGGYSALNTVGTPSTEAAAGFAQAGYSDCSLGVTFIAGAVNKNVVQCFDRRGLKAIGMGGGDCGILKLRGRNGARPGSTPVEIAHVDITWLDALCNLGITPVVASVGLTPQRQYCFTDPDTLASVFASQWKAHSLIFLTDIAGVRDANGSVIRWLDLRQASDLMHNSDETGGIRSKLRASQCALRSGVERVRIIPFMDAELLADFYVSRIDSGTEIFEGPSLAETVANGHFGW